MPRTRTRRAPLPAWRPIAGALALAVTAIAGTASPAVAANASVRAPIPVGWPAVSSASATTPVRVAPGVHAYSESYVTADGPEHAQVLDVRLDSGKVALDTVESHDRIADPADEPTTSMGDRTGALAGINGDYFAINAAGSPLGGVESDGRLLKSPRPNYQAQLTLDRNGTAHIGAVGYTASVRDGAATSPVASVNTVTDAASGEISELTPDLGATTTIPAATLVVGRWRGGFLTVQQVRASVTAVPALAPDQHALLGGGDGGVWLRSHVRPGDRLKVAGRLTDSHAQALISGATVLVRDGAAYDDPTGTPPSGRNPETMVGVSADGRHVLLVVIDGRQPDFSIGVTPEEAADYLVAHGVGSGLLLDGGGSSTIAARLPSTASLTILNRPSDAVGERPVANGLFVYRA